MKKILLSILISMTCYMASAQVMQVPIGVGETYTTLYAAVTDINDGLIYGDIELQITSSTYEAYVSSLNKSGVGDAYYTSIVIYPTVADVVIESPGPGVISLNNARNVTIDGRINRTGDPHSLTLAQTASWTNPTIRFVGGARFNSVQYCKLISQNNSIIFSAAVDTSISNSYNTISHNKISFANSTFGGQSMIEMANNANNNIIDGNEFIDYFYKYAMTLGGYAMTVSMSGFANEVKNNSFYLTTPVVPVQNIRQLCIYVGGTANITTHPPNSVSNNYIGGSAPMAAGTPMTIELTTASTQAEFVGIFAEGNSANTVYYTVDSNTITNIAINENRSNTYAFTGIYIKSAKVNILNNTIGSTTGTDHIQINNSTYNSKSFGILIENASPLVAGNKIGGITLLSSTAGQSNSFSGICKTQPRHFGFASTPVGYPIIQNNTIGSLTTPNSIQNTSTGSTNIIQATVGIEAWTTDSLLINNNQIANLANISEKNSAVDTGGAFGILIHGKAFGTITNNTIQDISSTCASTSAKYGSATGILVTSWISSPPSIVSNNTIKNISSLYTGADATLASGITISSSVYGPGSNVVTNNFIHNVNIQNSSTTANAIGIRSVNGWVVSAFNNVVVLTSGTGKVYGLAHMGTVSGSLYAMNNTVYIDGANTSLESACIYNASLNYNNILFNNKAVGTGNPPRHYAFRNNGTVGSGSIQNNMYYVPNATAGGRLMHYNGTPYEDMTTWVADFPGDALSQNANPLLINATGDNLSDFVAMYTFDGSVRSEFTNDILGVTRISYKTGAFEENTPLSAFEIQLSLALNEWNQPVVSWTMNDESDIVKYEIESSLLSKDWNAITEVAAADAGQYKITDALPLTAKRFYRIKAIATNGKVMYSNVQWIENKTTSTINVYPNPATHQIQIELNTTQGAQVTIRNMEGKVVKNINNYATQEMISIADLPSGTYLVAIKTAAYTQVEKIIKLK